MFCNLGYRKWMGLSEPHPSGSRKDESTGTSNLQRRRAISVEPRNCLKHQFYYLAVAFLNPVIDCCLTGIVLWSFDWPMGFHDELHSFPHLFEAGLGSSLVHYKCCAEIVGEDFRRDERSCTRTAKFQLLTRSQQRVNWVNRSSNCDSLGCPDGKTDPVTALISCHLFIVTLK